MAKISRSEVFDPKLFVQTEKEAQLLLTVLDNIETQLKSVLKVQEAALKGNKITNAKDVKAQADSIEKVYKAQKSLNSIDKEKIKLEQKLKVARSEKIQGNIELREVIREQNKINKELARDAQGLTSAYEKEARTLNKLRKQYKDLAVQGKANTEEGRKLLRQVTELDTKLKDVDATVGQHQRKVGQYENAWKGVNSRLKGFVKQAGFAITSAVGLGKAIQGANDSVKAFEEFDASINNVMTLLDAADRAEFGAGLEQGALDLVKNYGFAIEDVNTALFDAISAGVPAGEAIAFLNENAKSALAGNTALGTSIDGTTSVINAYGLKMTEAGDVQDAFFSAQKAGKTTVEELSNAIGTIAPLAKSLGISYQEVLAAQATLTKAGISTDEATTALKGLFTALQNPAQGAKDKIAELNEELGINIPKSASELKKVGLGNALRDINVAAEANEDAIAEILPNIRALTAATALQGDALNEYDSILKTVTEDTGEASSRMQGFEEVQKSASFRSKQLNGEIKEMQVEIGRKLLPIVNEIKAGFLAFGRFIIANRRAIVTLLKAVGAAALAYKAWTIQQKIANNQLTKGSRLEKLVAVSTSALSAAKALLTGNVKKANTAMKGLNRTFKISPIGLMITLGAGLASVFLDMGGAAEDAAIKQERLNNAQQRGVEIGKQLVEESSKELTQYQKDVDLLIQKAQERGATEEEILEIRRNAAKEAANIAEQQLGENQRVIDGEQAKIDKLGELEKKRQELLKLDTKANSVQESLDIIEARDKELAKIDAQVMALRVKVGVENQYGKNRADLISTEEAIRLLKEKINQIDEGNNGLLEQRQEYMNQLQVLQETENRLIEEASKEEQERAKKRQAELKAYQRRLEDLRDASIEDEEKRLIAQLKRKTQRELEEIKGRTKVEQELRIELEKKLEADIAEIRKDQAEKRKAEAEKEAMDKIDAELAAEKLRNEKLIAFDDERRIADLQAEQTAIEKKIDLNLKYGNDVTKLQEKLIEQKRRIATEEEKLEEEKLQANFKQEMEVQNKLIKERKLALLESGKTEEEIQQELLDQKIKALQEEIEIRKAFGQESIDQEIQLAEARLQKEKQLLDQRIEIYKNTEAVVDILAEKATEFIDKRIEGYDREIDAAKRRQDELRRLAEQGNLDAEKSLANEEAREKKLELKKQKAQRRKQLIEAGLAGFKAYGSKVEAGSQTPLRDVIRDFTALNQFIRALPAFYSGTERVGDDLGDPVLSGRDGHIVRVDSEERIVDPANNRKMAGISNSELGKMAEIYKTHGIDGVKSNSLNVGAIAYTGWESNKDVLRKFGTLESAVKGVEQAVKNIPQSSLDYEPLSDMIIERVKRIGTIENKHFKNGKLFE